MIPATVPCYARFKCKLGPNDDKGYWEYRRVLAWDDDGRALIIPAQGGQLIPADSQRNFDGLRDTDGYPPLVALIPAGGWRVERTAKDGGKSWSEPLVGWGLREDGDVVPLETDCTGAVMAVDEVDGEYRIYHDDQREDTPRAAAAPAAP